VRGDGIASKKKDALFVLDGTSKTKIALTRVYLPGHRSMSPGKSVVLETEQIIVFRDGFFFYSFVFLAAKMKDLGA